MKILLDINPLCASRAGIGNYIFHLTPALVRAQQDRANPFPGLRAFPRVQMALSHAGGRGFVGGTPARVRGDVDIYHIPYTAGPLPTRGCTRLVVTVHDLAFLRNPEFVADAERYRGLFHAAAEQMERADLVLADSENTARDVVAAYGLPPERVKTVSLAYDRDLFHPGPAPQEGSGAGALPPRDEPAHSW